MAAVFSFFNLKILYESFKPNIKRRLANWC